MQQLNSSGKQLVQLLKLGQQSPSYLSVCQCLNMLGFCFLIHFLGVSAGHSRHTWKITVVTKYTHFKVQHNARGGLIFGPTLVYEFSFKMPLP